MKTQAIQPDRRGISLLFVLVMTSAFIIILGAVVEYSVSQLSFSRQRVDREYALTVAEAGINYYRWHLAHVPDDFQDGTAGPGPYTHDYRDSTGSVIGKFELTITPPQSGSTIATIRSTGWLDRRPELRRSIEIQLGLPAFTQFAVAADDYMRFGTGTVVNGPIHSNNGIRFDGLANNLVTSGVDDYDDPDHNESGTDPLEFGVHTHVAPRDPLPPAAVPSRPDVFAAGRQFPVAPIDFNGIIVDLQQIKTNSIASGIYLGPSGARGYHINFRVDSGETRVDIRRVDTLRSCQYRSSSAQAWTDYADTFSVNTESEFTYDGGSSLNLPVPANGVIFAEDDIWVDGQISGARITVVAAREPLASSDATIIINNDLRYSLNDGSDAIGLIAQRDVSVGFYSEDDLRIDGAMIAQTGRAGRYLYQPHPGYEFNPAGCDSNIMRERLTLNGTIATKRRYGFAWVSNSTGLPVSGYRNRDLNFDSHLVFAPPPYFPTTGQYTLLSWQEL